MNEITTLSHKECVEAIEADGSKITIMLEGEPGIGKSFIGQEIAKRKGYHFTYLDVANMSLGDLMYPVPDRERKCMEFYPNESFRLHTGEPLVIMLDEFTKGSKEVKNMLLPLVLERRLGSVHLHPDTIVFATGNMSGDGVGDSIQAHQRNRFVMVKMRKPSAEEWINDYALNHGIDATVIAFVDQYPHVMQSYLDDKDGTNAYIFNPKKQQTSYASPRSLEFASHAIKTRADKSVDALHAELVGSLGAPAAADLVNFVRMNEQLPPFASIVADPEGTSLPKEPVNRLLLTYNLIVRSEKDNIVPVLKYIKRMNNEMQALFVSKLLSTSSKQAWAVMVKELKEDVMRLHPLFS